MANPSEASISLMVACPACLGFSLGDPGGGCVAIGDLGTLLLLEDFSRFIAIGEGGLELTGVMGVVSGVVGVASGVEGVVGVPDLSLSPVCCSMDGIIVML